MEFMETKDIMFLIAIILALIWCAWNEYKDKDNYCKCGHDDTQLWLKGWCSECGKPDGDWYP